MDYTSPTAPVLGPKTRSTAPLPCCCSVCEVGRLKLAAYKEFKERVTEPVGRPYIDLPSAEPEPIKVCSACLTNWGPGQQHNCNKSTKRENIEELVRKNSPKTKGRIVSSQLKEVFTEQGASTRGGTVVLHTDGSPISASLGVFKQKPAPKFSNEILNKLQIKAGISDNKMKIVDNFLRVNCGRSSVIGHEKHMVERNSRLEEMFDHTKVVMIEYINENVDGENGKQKKKKVTCEKEKPVAYAKDVEHLAKFVLEHRQLDASDALIQVGIDDGQGLIKIMMSVKEKNPKETQEGRKKSKYNEGFAPREFQLSGVKRLILLLSSTVEHHNISKMLELLNIKAVDFGLCCDLKMILILLGKQNASSKHCCPFCLGSSPWIGKFESVTIGSLWANYLAFQQAGAPLKRAKDFNNVVNQPLITGPDEQKILGEAVYFPEHHVFTGIVGKLIKELERNLFDSAEEGLLFMDNWMKNPGVNVSRTVYHGSASLIGNQAERLLGKVRSLEAELLQKLGDTDKGDLARLYIKALEQFDHVVHSCFGQTLKPRYQDHINDFMLTYRSLGISIPLKVHLLESHAVEFIQMMGGEHGLGYFSEQAMESMHRELLQEWGGEKVDINHSSYGENLKRTMVRVNGKHL